MNKIALFGVIALSALMVGCTSTQTRDCDDSQDCKPALCEDAANCDASKCDKPDCAKKAAACPTGDKAACPTGGKKGACKDGCTKPCCANKAAACPSGKKAACDSDCIKNCEDKMACNHANTTFVCPNGACTPEKPCCGDCAAKIAALCPDCMS